MIFLTHKCNSKKKNDKLGLEINYTMIADFKVTIHGVMTLNVPENFFSVIVLLWNSFSGTALE